jgi:hypothetical protein
MAAYIPEKVDVIEIRQPVFVIGGKGALAVKANETVKLGANPFGIGVKFIVTQYFPHFGFSRRVADPGGPAAQKGYSPVARIPQVPEREIRNHVADMKTLPGRIRSLIEGNRPLIHEA